MLNLTQGKHRNTIHLQNTSCLMNGERFHTIMPAIQSTDSNDNYDWVDSNRSLVGMYVSCLVGEALVFTTHQHRRVKT